MEKDVREEEPKYPCCILPSTDYVREIDVQSLIDLHAYVQRKSGRPEKECLGDSGKVTPAAFGIKGLAGMSVNILGGNFLVGHERWHQSGNGTKYWDETAVDISGYEGCYSFDVESASVYLEIGKIHGLHWKFPRTFENQAAFDKQRDSIIEGYTESFRKTQLYKMQAHCNFEHRATFLNYWHGELHTIIESNPNEDLSKDSGAYRKSALHNFIETIRDYASLQPPVPLPQIPENSYKR